MQTKPLWFSANRPVLDFHIIIVTIVYRDESAERNTGRPCERRRAQSSPSERKSSSLARAISEAAERGSISQREKDRRVSASEHEIGKSQVARPRHERNSGDGSGGFANSIIENPPGGL